MFKQHQTCKNKSNLDKTSLDKLKQAKTSPNKFKYDQTCQNKSNLDETSLDKFKQAKTSLIKTKLVKKVKSR
jgi:hypothetical protein